tara:strand:+ start:230 stop:505 length:276 start_codon:yes stop_codon:yes gene_type:complete
MEKLIKYIDLLARTDNLSSTFLFYIYDDGAVDKRLSLNKDKLTHLSGFIILGITVLPVSSFFRKLLLNLSDEESNIYIFYISSFFLWTNIV